jgi:hypothetical protein
MIEAIYYKGKDMQKEMFYKYKYDSNGNQIEMNFYRANGSLIQTQTNKYIYDKIGNWIKRSYFESGKLMIIQKREINYYE